MGKAGERWEVQGEEKGREGEGRRRGEARWVVEEGVCERC